MNKQPGATKDDPLMNLRLRPLLPSAVEKETFAGACSEIHLGKLAK